MLYIVFAGAHYYPDAGADGIKHIGTDMIEACIKAATHAGTSDWAHVLQVDPTNAHAPFVCWEKDGRCDDGKVVKRPIFNRF